MTVKNSSAGNMPGSRPGLVRIATLGFLLLFVSATCPKTLASGVAARSSLRAQAMDFVLEGRITQKAPGKLTVGAGQNIVFTVTYDDKTEIEKKDGSTGSSEDLQVGIKVRVEGVLTESGEVQALKIEIQGK